MQQVLTDFLFNKRVFVYDEQAPTENPCETVFALANMFGIKITAGSALAQVGMIEQASRLLGRYVPPAFYKGFPESVKKLTKDELLYDQLIHYMITYGFGFVEDGGHSLMEENFERLAFRESVEVKEFKIIKEAEAVETLRDGVAALFKSTRPISEAQYQFLLAFIKDYGYKPAECLCSVTAIRLLIDTGNFAYANFLRLSDVVRFVDELNYRKYDNENVKKLNLKNADRKTVAKLIGFLVEASNANVRDCFEKKAIWAGLLHHIHYQPKTEKGEEFVALMRGKENRSVYSDFEKAMSAFDIERATETLLQGKGSGALLRNLNYILSRCKDEKDVAFVMSKLRSNKGILLLQLLQQYAYYGKEERRTFLFTKYEKLRKHKETEEEQARRKSEIPETLLPTLLSVIRDNLRKVYKNRLGKVYLDEKMKMTALPLQETASQGGFGVLPKGSRLPLETGKKIRAFTYWEKVDDIDLSVIALGDNGEQMEFSWRTMYENQGEEITFSGDQTSGYNGGSEFYDIQFAAFKKKYPRCHYLVFCDNVYSCSSFKDCICRAGYMMRDEADSGEIFEPKTVQSSFTINCDSSSAYLFALDVKKMEFVWLNLANDSFIRVAGAEDLQYLKRYLEATDLINVYDFIEMAATELVDTPEEADVIVSDDDSLKKDGVEIIHSYDFEKLLALMN